MDTEKLRQPCSSSELKRAGSSQNKEDPEIDDRGYTSLKDVLTRSFSNFNFLNNEDSQSINSSNISIKNVLVKHAASAYVQSAFLAQRDTNCLTTLLERIRDRAYCGTFWYIYVTKPMDACFSVVFRFFHHMVYGIHRFWRNMITILR